MDNLPLHKAYITQEQCKRLNISVLWNVPWSPEFNAIEAVFSKPKSLFNRKRLNCLVNKVGFNVDREIRAAFRLITVEHCAACVRKSFFLLQKASQNK